MAENEFENPCFGDVTVAIEAPSKRKNSIINVPIKFFAYVAIILSVSVVSVVESFTIGTHHPKSDPRSHYLHSITPKPIPLNNCLSWSTLKGKIFQKNSKMVLSSFSTSGHDNFENYDDDENIERVEEAVNEIEEMEEDLAPLISPLLGLDEEEHQWDADALQSLTVAQLKQQLRLRRLKVSGRKGELIERLLMASSSIDDSDDVIEGSDDIEYELLDEKSSREVKKKKKKEDVVVDVSAFLDEKDKGKAFRSLVDDAAKIDDDDEEEEESKREPEVWGKEAKIVDDYGDNRVVIDSLSRTKVQYLGSNQTWADAYVVASNDALKFFLSGGSKNNETVLKGATEKEKKLKDIQVRRELASKRPMSGMDNQGEDEGDEVGNYENILHRDYTDWGKFTLTGAQLSASEVQGVLLLCDGEDEDVEMLAEKIAFECQPVVVMVPDLNRHNKEKTEILASIKDKKQIQDVSDYIDLRKCVDIRAAAACLRELYGVSSVSVWGAGVGGGLALEAAAGVFPKGNVYDINGELGPPPVDPMVAIAWYPTNYKVDDLFGDDHKGYTVTPVDGDGKKNLAVMAMFAGKDTNPGATSDDAEVLKSFLESDERIKDVLIKIFPGQDHGFAHVGISKTEQHDNEEDAEFEAFIDSEFGGAGRVLSPVNDEADVACLLSTAFMETYSRVFLPTVGMPIHKNEEEPEWKNDLAMRDLSAKSPRRNIRKETEEAINNHVETPLEGRRIDPTDKSQRKELAEILMRMQEEELESDISKREGYWKIEPDDEIDVMYAKLKANDDSFQLF